MASDATEPTVDPALETAASALRADLVARGVPADELPEPVMLALARLATVLADQGRRIEGLEGAAAQRGWFGLDAGSAGRAVARGLVGGPGEEEGG